MENTSLGNCCICEQASDAVRNIITLHLKTPETETKGGWVCFTCNREPRGAVAVLCDDCLAASVEKKDEIVVKFACLGYPGENRRIEIGKLTEPYDHDVSKHPETWNWEQAWNHFCEIRQQYRELADEPGVNTTIALGAIFQPLAKRYYRGERSFELYEALRAVE